MNKEVSANSALKGDSITRFMRKLHIYSAMPVLLIMIFFAVTGIFLNHPDFDVGKVDNRQQSLDLPNTLISLENWDEDYAIHGLSVLHWLDRAHGIRGVDFDIEWDDMDKLLIINLSGPNGSTLIEVFLEDAVAEVDQRELSTLAMLNNVHRAKHISGAWRFLSDLSAICMLLFCFSGFWLLLSNRLERRSANSTFVLGSSLFLLIIYLMH